MSTTTTLAERTTATPVEHFDVLIVGAGISGVGAAYHLQQQCPEQELRRARGARELRRHLAMHTYPGHPLRQRPLHVRLPVQAVDERTHRLRERDPQVHGRGHRRERPRTATSATTTGSPRPRGRATRTSGRSRPPTPSTGEVHRFTTNFLWMCQGYYRHSEGYTPEWPGMDRFRVPSCTPRRGRRTSTTGARRSSCIGSGATTATLVPAIAADGEHVTVLQRSPTYFWTGAQRQRAGRHAARARDRRDVDPRDRPPQGAPRPAGDHPAVVRGARAARERS